jgi:hypothetical protein
MLSLIPLVESYEVQRLRGRSGVGVDKGIARVDHESEEPKPRGLLVRMETCSPCR